MNGKKDRKISSGSLLRGSADDATQAAIGLLDELSIDYGRCCVIVVMNECKYDLVCGKLFDGPDSDTKVPERIATHSAGIITSQKTVKGVRGVVSYQLRNLPDESEGKFLQIMWQVPLDLTTFGIKCNVNLGKEEAQASLLKDMKNGYTGVLYNADETPITMQFNGFKAAVAMSNSEKTVLTVKVTK